MRVTFPRRPDHQRDYALVERDDGTAGRRYGGPAGPRLPHDIVLLVVERELRIRDGLWGGIAAGLALDRGPGLRAELLADLVSSAAALDHLTPATIGRLAEARLSVLPDAAADPAAIAVAARALQVEAARWARLRVGEKLCYEWPARLCFRPPDREHGRLDARPDEVICRGAVTLRRWRPDDLEAVLAAVTSSAGQLSPWLSWAAGYRRESAQEFLARAARDWADGTAYGYAITTGGALAGGIGLMARIGPGGLEIGYWVRQAYARRGLATAAAAALVEQAFRLPGVDRVEIVHDELNVASGGVPRKLGFTEVERRPMDVPAPAGTGVGVVWRLVR
jgi:ribosomal-protein-serine acetyltransferase